MRFTHELPCKDSIRFLDLQLSFCADGHACWMYSPRTSKLVKRGITSLCLSNALKKSCFHTAQRSFRQQEIRLKEAGYPSAVLSAVAEKIFKKLRSGNSEACSKPEIDKKKIEVMPYLHKVSHNVKKVAKRHGVNIVFSAPCKLSGLCSRVVQGDKRKAKCTTRTSPGMFRAPRGWFIRFRCRAAKYTSAKQGDV